MTIELLTKADVTPKKSRKAAKNQSSADASKGKKDIGKKAVKKIEATKGKKVPAKKAPIVIPDNDGTGESSAPLTTQSRETATRWLRLKDDLSSYHLRQPNNNMADSYPNAIPESPIVPTGAEILPITAPRKPFAFDNGGLPKPRSDKRDKEIASLRKELQKTQEELEQSRTHTSNNDGHINELYDSFTAFTLAVVALVQDSLEFQRLVLRPITEADEDLPLSSAITAIESGLTHQTTFRNTFGNALLDLAERHGNYAEVERQLQAKIPGGRYMEFEPEALPPKKRLEMEGLPKYYPNPVALYQAGAVGPPPSPYSQPTFSGLGPTTGGYRPYLAPGALGGRGRGRGGPH
ncbi:hypothetical protein BLS_002379 [Venturia inaequalis]|uniref:Uncharacterized protein n=1 Tax=Venturia inaequalis TaxID=5025 RepID=A0A8H3YKS7_VENIN|nr:hypothetical protein BLS_002379 [Venturia inaequalis]